MSEGISGLQNYGSKHSSLCHQGTIPARLTGMLRDLLVRHFRDDNPELIEIRPIRWRDSADTDIVIEASYHWDPTKTGNRPAIIIRREECVNARVGIGDRPYPQAADGQSRLETFWNGAHVLFCLGATGGQAESLASEVYRHVHMFQHEIRQEFRLHSFRVESIGRVSEVEESSEHFVVPVKLVYQIDQAWLIIQQAPRFGGADVEFDLQ